MKIAESGRSADVEETVVLDVQPPTGRFSDWPAAVTYYANCMGLK
jgi:hypothetical protein